MILEFVETPIYTEQIDSLITTEEHRQLQLFILESPDRGDLMPRSGGLRKIRWKKQGSGKRGGIRVIYYLWNGDTAFMLFAYAKNKQENLRDKQVKMLRTLIENYTNEGQ